MKLETAIEIFNKLESRSDSKREKKVYNTYIAILSDLKARNLTSEEVDKIEKKLDGFDLDQSYQQKLRYFKKNLELFKSYLKDAFSLTPEGYYKGIGIAIGMMFGLIFGTSLGTAFGLSSGVSSGLGLGMMAGMIIGMMIGQAKDAEAVKEGRVYSVSL
jgi:ubiquitin